MKTAKIIMLVAAVTLFATCTKDYGSLETRTYTLTTSYKALSISNAFDVVMSDTATVATITMPERLYEKLVFSVVNGTLRIGLKPGINYVGDNEMRVILPVNTDINDVDVSGASSFTSPQTIVATDMDIDVSGASFFKCSVQATNVELDISGASTYNGDIEATTIDADISGSSTVTVGGTADIMDIDVSGASTLAATKLAAGQVTGDVSGASNVNVTVCQKLELNVSGSSNVTYGKSDESCAILLRCSTTGSSTVTER